MIFPPADRRPGTSRTGYERDVLVATTAHVGTAAAQQLLAINCVGATKLVRLHRLLFSWESVVVANNQMVELFRSNAVATGGTALTHEPRRQSQRAATLVALGPAIAITPGASARSLIRACVSFAGSGVLTIDVDLDLEPNQSFNVRTDALSASVVLKTTAWLTESTR